MAPGCFETVDRKEEEVKKERGRGRAEGRKEREGRAKGDTD